MPARPGAWPIAGVLICVTRPFQVIPEPDRFIQGALQGLSEELVRVGYDPLGVCQLDRHEGADDVLEHLEDINARRPGTGVLHLTFVEAPSLVGFGTAYNDIRAAVYAPDGFVTYRMGLDLPARRPVIDLLLPRRTPEADGRQWARRVWAAQLAAVFPRRGPPPGPDEGS